MATASSPAMLVIAVPAALVGTASFGLASAAQQRATQQVPTVRTLDPRLLLELVRQPLWVLGAAWLAVATGVLARRSSQLRRDFELREDAGPSRHVLPGRLAEQG